MKIKRIGKKQLLTMLKENYYIQYNEWFVLNAGYKVIDINKNIVGFITFDLFCDLFQNKLIKAIAGGYGSTIYDLI
jgi:hypothetical protein